jgi:hypothetical protein
MTKLVEGEKIIENLGRLKVIWVSFLNFDISKREVIITNKRVILTSIILGIKIITNSVWFDKSKNRFILAVKLAESHNFFTRGKFAELECSVNNFHFKYRLYSDKAEELKNKIELAMRAGDMA